MAEVLSDAEKTAVLVERLFGGGKWPRAGVLPHEARHGHGEPCARCGITDPRNFMCSDFDPFTRIEDAFAVVEKSGAWFVRLQRCEGTWHCSVSIGDHGGQQKANTPQRAIAEAAYLAVTAE